MHAADRTTETSPETSASPVSAIGAELDAWLEQRLAVELPADREAAAADLRRALASACARLGRRDTDGQPSQMSRRGEHSPLFAERGLFRT